MIKCQKIAEYKSIFVLSQKGRWLYDFDYAHSKLLVT